MIPDTSDPRRIVKRWGTACLVIVLSAMAVIRVTSVKHRARDSHALKAQSAGGIGEATAPIEIDGSVGAAASRDAALEHVIFAGNDIRIEGTDGGGSIVVGDLHNNAREGGDATIDGSNDVYGLLTSAGTVSVGLSDGNGPAVVYGSIVASKVVIGEFGEIRDFEDLSEPAEGVDLDRDGDLEDLNVGRTRAAVKACKEIVSGDEHLLSGDSDVHIANGTQPVEIKASCPGAVVEIAPDFRAYYETVTGLDAYPPETNHATRDIAGDGEGHYFSSARDFLEWINSHQQTDALCWRCAGDGRIGPENDTTCPTCEGTGKTPAVEIAGVFYVDDETLDLSRIETNLVVHGTIVVAEGNPYRWPAAAAAGFPRSTRDDPTMAARNGPGTIDRRPTKGSLVIGSPTRMNFTQTYRADADDGPYQWRHRAVQNGDDRQYIPLREPGDGHALKNFPAILAASTLAVTPRTAGFARFAGDVGDEAVTVLQGVVFAGSEVRIGGRGGWKGDPIVFDEEERRSEDDILDEAVLRVDLNDDGDVLDLVKVADVSGRPAIRAAKGRYTVDINNDGILGAVTLGEDYGDFFAKNGYALPVLYYHEGAIVADSVRIGGQCAVLFDAGREGSPIVGFKTVSAGAVSGAMLSRKNSRAE